MIEKIILSNLIHDDEYVRKVLPYMKREYFGSREYSLTFDLIREYFNEYNSLPTSSALQVELENKTIDQDTYDACKALIKEISQHDTTDFGWLIDQTEKYCQEKAVYNAIMDSIQILENKKKDLDKGAIPSLLQDALGVSFDTHVGHDFLENADERFDFYHKTESRIPFDLDIMNKITRGGLPNKTLNVIIAGTGVGKTLMMCHFAAANLMEGRNVLYVTLEMAEERIAERIDSNLTNVPLNELELLPKDSYKKKIDKIKDKTNGKLIIKEYPTATVGANHFRHLLNELKTKKKFVPDIIYIDYINLCTSARMKAGANYNMYSYIKSIAEELRGLAVEFNLPIVSATQTNRTGFTNSDPGMEDTAESFGLPQTVDFMIAAVTSDELASMRQLMIKQLKTRYNDPNYYRKFVIGIDKSRMKLYDVEEAAQKNIVRDVSEETPAMDNSAFADGLKRSKFDRKAFEDFAS